MSARETTMGNLQRWGGWRAAADYLVYLAVRMLICIVQALPPKSCHAFAKGLAWLAVDVLRIRKGVVADNLVHAFPLASPGRRREIERQMWQHLGLLICEIAQAGRRIHETNWRQHVRLHGAADLVGLLLRRGPLVAVTGHVGNFEMCGFLAGVFGFPTHTVARPLDNRFLQEFLMTFRQSTGQFILPTRGSAPDVQRVMDAGGTISLLGDHYGGSKGCWVDYFGRPASCHKSIALLALANNAPLLTIFARRLDGFLRFELVVGGVHDPKSQSCGETVPELTQWYTSRVERFVRENPGQYWWLHRRWKDDRDRHRQRRRPMLATPAA